MLVQRRFREHLIRDEADYARHVEYCYTTRSNTASSRGCATGLIRRFIAMFARDYFRRIGLATVKRAVISANDDDRAAAGPERRITPTAPRLARTRWAPIRPTAW